MPHQKKQKRQQQQQQSQSGPAVVDSHKVAEACAAAVTRCDVDAFAFALQQHHQQLPDHDDADVHVEEARGGDSNEGSEGSSTPTPDQDNDCGGLRSGESAPRLRVRVVVDSVLAAIWQRMGRKPHSTHADTSTPIWIFDPKRRGLVTQFLTILFDAVPLYYTPGEAGSGDPVRIETATLVSLLTGGANVGGQILVAPVKLAEAFCAVSLLASSPHSVEYIGAATSVWFGQGRLSVLRADAFRDAFACDDVVHAWCQLSKLATTNDAIDCICMIIISIVTTVLGVASAHRGKPFANPAVVAAWCRMAKHANSTICVVQLLRVVILIINDTVISLVVSDADVSRRKNTHDAANRKNIFATPEVAVAWCHFAIHATSAESVEVMAGAVACITAGNDAGAANRRNIFGSTEVVKAWCQMWKHANSSGSVRFMAAMVWNIVVGDDADAAHRKSIFATAEVVAIWCRLAKHATSAVAAEEMAKMLANMMLPGGVDKSVFAKAEVVEAWCFLCKFATTDRSVVSVTAMVGFITSGSDASVTERQDMFAKDEVVEGWCGMRKYATSENCLQSMASMVTYITTGDDDNAAQRKNLFTKAEVVDTWCQMQKQATSAVSQLTSMILSLTSGDDDNITNRKNMFAKPEVAAAWCHMCKYATSALASYMLRVVVSIVDGDDPDVIKRRNIFANDDVVKAWCRLSKYATSEDESAITMAMFVAMLTEQTNRCCSPVNLANRKNCFAKPAVVVVFSSCLLKHATSTNAEQSMSWMVANITSGGDADAPNRKKLFAVAELKRIAPNTCFHSLEIICLMASEIKGNNEIHYHCDRATVKLWRQMQTELNAIRKKSEKARTESLAALRSKAKVATRKVEECLAAQDKARKELLADALEEFRTFISAAARTALAGIRRAAAERRAAAASMLQAVESGEGEARAAIEDDGQRLLSSLFDDASHLLQQPASTESAEPVDAGGNDRDDEVAHDNSCVVCIDSPKTHIAVPCGHQTVCEGCVDGMLKQQREDTEELRRNARTKRERANVKDVPLVCPVCRTEVSLWMKVFK